VRFSSISVDFPTYEVIRAGEAVHLTPTEFRLLAAPIRDDGQDSTRYSINGICNNVRRAHGSLKPG
jgi:DNA-binding response OmpR family regulator